MTQPALVQPDLIPRASFLQMTPAEIDAAFGGEAASAAIEITKDVRNLTETEVREEKKTA